MSAAVVNAACALLGVLLGSGFALLFYRIMDRRESHDHDLDSPFQWHATTTTPRETAGLFNIVRDRAPRETPAERAIREQDERVAAENARRAQRTIGGPDPVLVQRIRDMTGGTVATPMPEPTITQAEPLQIDELADTHRQLEELRDRIEEGPLWTPEPEEAGPMDTPFELGG